MPRFRRGASSTPRPRDSSADVPGILDGPVKPDDEERRGITAPRARFCGAGDHAQHAGRPAVPIAARPPRNSGAAGPRVALDDADLYRHRLGAVIRSGLADADQRDTAPRGQAIDAVRRTNDVAPDLPGRLLGPGDLIGRITEQDGHRKAQRLPLQASFNGSGLILTYLVVLAIEAWPISFDNRQASMPPLACIVPVVCRRQCGCTGQVIFAFCRQSRSSC